MRSGYPEVPRHIIHASRRATIKWNLERKHVNMLPANLTTNEVKNSAGTEEEFLWQSSSDRTKIYQKSGMAPNAEHTVKIQHQEVGSGLDLRRRSNTRVDKTIAGASGAPRTISFYCVGDVPIGDLPNTNEIKNVLANLIALLASNGADTTVKFDCSGTMADALVNGTL